MEKAYNKSKSKRQLFFAIVVWGGYLFDPFMFLFLQKWSKHKKNHHILYLFIESHPSTMQKKVAFF